MKLRSLLRLLAGCVALAAMADSCAPVITVVNRTEFTVRAIVQSDGKSQVVSPSAGEQSIAEGKEGPYKVIVIPDKDWLEQTSALRQVLSNQLANPKDLTTAQVEEIIQRLKTISSQIAQYEASASSKSSCKGAITEKGGGTATVTADADGNLFVYCQ